MATISKPMTFAEFEKLPDRECRFELRHGEPVEVPPPKHGHKMILRLLRRSLGQAAGRAGEVEEEIGFKLGDRNYRVADVAFVSRELWDSTPKSGYISRAPELVIEVLSPSNTETEMRDKRKVCLENGSREFWIVDSTQREVEVWTPDGRSIIYKSPQSIPLFFAPGQTLNVDSVFE